MIVASCKPMRPWYVSEELRSYMLEEILLWTLMLNLSKEKSFFLIESAGNTFPSICASITLKFNLTQHSFDDIYELSNNK